MNTLKPSKISTGHILITDDGTRHTVDRTTASGDELFAHFVHGGCETFKRRYNGAASPVRYDRQATVADGPEGEHEREDVLIAHGLDPHRIVECPECEGKGATYGLQHGGTIADTSPSEGWAECEFCEGGGVELQLLAVSYDVESIVDWYADDEGVAA